MSLLARKPNISHYEEYRPKFSLRRHQTFNIGAEPTSICGFCAKEETAKYVVSFPALGRRLTTKDSTQQVIQSGSWEQGCDG